MTALSNKVAIVTGASAGIGRATARLFAREGAHVVAGARRKQELDALVDEIRRAGGDAIALAGDVGDEGYARALVEAAVERFGRLDVAFNNAATVGALRPAPELSLAEWDEVIRVNLTGAFMAAKHQIPAMLARGGGSIVFTSTFVGYTVGMPNMAAYASSKAGIIGLTKVLAAEYGARGIRVNALLPGGTDTPMGRTVMNTPEALAFVRGLHAMKRIAAPEEIAQAALYLASDMSSFTTGAALLADGGVSITRT
ncbi:SDR family oxidoreductase [Sorangium sp. So ce260]|uniref:SDR family oxidoreductase n=1 Tax=Sorangium sp. So ce260 TaxID=3133291 RepID=UPI003F6101EE